LLASVVLVVNIGVIAAVLLPSFVTYAKLPVPNVVCGNCANPEVQLALAKAAAIGRSETASRIIDLWPWWLLLVVMNVAAPAVAWRLRGNSVV
jgi:hypothetical protein